jgi:hypothetical protein
METPLDGDSDDARQPGKWWSRRATVWLVGALALITATSAAALTASGPKAAAPKPASDTHRNALDSILLKDPTIGTPVQQLIRAAKLPKPTYRGDTGRVGVPAHLSHPAAPAGKISRYVPGSVTGDFNLLQLASLALYEGCSRTEAPIAAAIAAAESGGNPGAQGDISLMDGTWDWSQGLWQIRGLRSERGTGGLRDSLANADPEKNASAMYAISNGCTDWTPWSTYTSGAYLAYLGMSKTAVLAAKHYEGETGSLPPYDSGAPVSRPMVPAAPPSSSHPKSHPSGKSSQRPKSGSSSHKTQPGRHPSGGGASTGAAASNPQPTHGANPVSSNPAPKPTLPVPLPTKTKAPVPLPTKTTAPVPLPTKSKLPLPLPTKHKLPVPTPTVSVP